MNTMDKKVLPLLAVLPFLLGGCLSYSERLREGEQMMWQVERDARLGYPDGKEYRECNYEASRAMGGYQPGPYDAAPGELFRNDLYTQRANLVRQCMGLKGVRDPRLPSP
jgi:hypothetical protein